VPRGRPRAHWCLRRAPALHPPHRLVGQRSVARSGGRAPHRCGEARQPATQPACTAADKERNRRGRPRSRPARFSEGDRPTFSIKHTGSRCRPPAEVRRGPTRAPLANGPGGRQRNPSAGALGTGMNTGGAEEPWRPLPLVVVDRETRVTRKLCAAFCPHARPRGAGVSARADDSFLEQERKRAWARQFTGDSSSSAALTLNNLMTPAVLKPLTAPCFSCSSLLHQSWRYSLSFTTPGRPRSQASTNSFGRERPLYLHGLVHSLGRGCSHAAGNSRRTKRATRRALHTYTRGALG